MRGDSRSESKEGLALREREGTSFPCRSHPHTPQAKPVSLGSIKSTGGVESASGSIQRFVVKTRRIRPVAPRDPNSGDDTDAGATIAVENDEALELEKNDEERNETETQTKEETQRKDNVDTGNSEGEEACGKNDRNDGRLNHNDQVGPFSESDVENRTTQCVTAAARRKSGGGTGSYDWFDECEREEQGWENGLVEAEDPFADDDDGQLGQEPRDMSDADKFLFSIRKCAMTPRDEQLRGDPHDDASNSSASSGRLEDGSGPDSATNRDDYFSTKGARTKCFSSKVGGVERTNTSLASADSGGGGGVRKRSVPNTEGNSDDDLSIPLHSPSKRNSDSVLLTERAQYRHHHQFGTRSREIVQQDNWSIEHNPRKLSRSYRSASDTDHVGGPERTRYREAGAAGTRANGTDRSHVCDHTDELDMGGVRTGDKIRRGDRDESRETKELDLSSGDTRPHLLPRKDIRCQRETIPETSPRASTEIQGCKRDLSQQWDQTSESTTQSGGATQDQSPLPKIVTFAKGVKSADNGIDDYAYDDDNEETDEDEDDEETDEYEDSQEETSQTDDNIQSSKSRNEGGSVSSCRTKSKRGVASVVKHHTVSTADLDSDGAVSGPILLHHPLHHTRHPPPPTAPFSYMSLSPHGFSRHLHPHGSAIGSATSKRRFLSLPLLEQDSSEVDSCSSSTDVSPGDSNVATATQPPPPPVAGSTSSVAVTYPGTRLLNPGEVYYFAPNSCVVCVERNKLTPTRIQVSI